MSTNDKRLVMGRMIDRWSDRYRVAMTQDARDSLVSLAVSGWIASESEGKTTFVSAPPQEPVVARRTTIVRTDGPTAPRAKGRSVHRGGYDPNREQDVPQSDIEAGWAQFQGVWDTLLPGIDRVGTTSRRFIKWTKAYGQEVILAALVITSQAMHRTVARDPITPERAIAYLANVLENYGRGDFSGILMRCHRGVVGRVVSLPFAVPGLDGPANQQQMWVDGTVRQ